MRGFTFEQAADHAARIFLLGPALALISFAVWRRWKAERFADRINPRTLALASSAFSILLLSFMIFFVFRGRPIVDDELTYSSTARFYSYGRIGGEVPPDMIREPFTVITLRGATGKYLPGESLVQVPGVRVGYPALMHIPLALLILFCVWRATRLLGGDELAGWTTALVALSPMFIYCNATGQSQTSSLAAIAVAGLGYAEAKTARPWVGALLVSIGVVFGVFCRIQAMVPIGTVLVIATLFVLYRSRNFLALSAMLAVLAAGAATLAWFNWYLTGSPTKLPWALFSPVEHWGFGRVWTVDSYTHNFRTLLENLAVVIVRMNVWWLGWPLGILLLVYWWRIGRPSDGGVRMWLIASSLFIAVQAAYYSTGISDVGPIYHFELLIPLGLIGGNTIVAALKRSPRLAIVVLLLQFGVGTTQFLVTQGLRLERLVTVINMGAEDVVERMHKPAFVMVEGMCSEALRIGWLHSNFPQRCRTPDCDVISYTRPAPSVVPNYIRYFRNRNCYYVRHDPKTWELVLYTCDEAKGLLQRPITFRDCLSVPSTAQILGWYDPQRAILRRYQEVFGKAALEKITGQELR